MSEVQFNTPIKFEAMQEGFNAALMFGEDYKDAVVADLPQKATWIKDGNDTHRATILLAGVQKVAVAVPAADGGFFAEVGSIANARDGELKVTYIPGDQITAKLTDKNGDWAEIKFEGEYEGSPVNKEGIRRKSNKRDKKSSAGGCGCSYTTIGAVVLLAVLALGAYKAGYLPFGAAKA